MWKRCDQSAEVYGLTKLEGEQAIASVGCAHLIRTSWVYGRRKELSDDNVEAWSERRE
ncbi:sugar nucleotide-binding protein [Burkholderia multivorans]|uniref:sugar nucleotide-binding protein n=1 Tax=Burkholderia multivorans TaxID=87883 RepID=UPI0030C81218